MMLSMRKAALRLLPLVVAVWATLAVVGGGYHLAKEANAQDSAAKAGLGLCALSVALLVRAGVRRVLRPRPVGKYEPLNTPLRVARPAAYRKPPLPGVPTLQLLQVSRT